MKRNMKFFSHGRRCEREIPSGQKNRCGAAEEFIQMKKIFFYIILSVFAFNNYSFAQNPIVRTMYSADPTARVFGDSIYLYPSHDILATPGHGRAGWFCMEDNHVFSSEDLTHWKDNGVVVTQYNVPWVDSTSYSMWAPDCIERNGKYYFYFPAQVNAGTGKGFGIGVAVSDKPYGPFVPEASPIRGVHGIDPNVFIDKDGQAYLYFAEGNIYVAKLKSNMLELASEPQIVQALPGKGLKEGPFLFERKGVYYLTYPHVADKTEQLEYAIADNPLGPFKVTGVIMDEWKDCWTNHQSIVKCKGQWYLFYHHDDYSPTFDKARSVRADSLFFNADGTIQKVVPTLRGIGVTLATDTIQIDRYSAISNEGIKIDFIDTTDVFKGWKIILSQPGTWVKYNSVAFGKKKLKTVYARVASATAGTLQIKLDSLNSPVLAELKFAGDKNKWHVVSAPLSLFPKGIHHLVVVQKGREAVNLDWLLFN